MTTTPGRDVPQSFQALAEAAVHSRAAAVKLFCAECTGFVRADVTNCTATQCPLWRWRPYQQKDASDKIPMAQPAWLRRKPVAGEVGTSENKLDGAEDDFDNRTGHYGAVCE